MKPSIALFGLSLLSFLAASTNEVSADESLDPEPPVIDHEGDTETALKVKHVGVVEILVDEKRGSKRRGHYTLHSRFHSLDEAIALDAVLSADEPRAPGCFLDYPLTPVRPVGLPAYGPERDAPDDIQLALASEDGAVKAEIAAEPLTELSENDIDQSPQGSAEADIQPARPSPSVAVRGPRRGLIDSGSTIRLRGRGFGKFGKVALPVVPPLDVQVTTRNGKGERRALRAPHRLRLAWTPGSDPEALINIELVMSGLASGYREASESGSDVGDLLHLVCNVPDNGAFDVPGMYRSAIRDAAPSETALRVVRASQAWTQKGRSVLRIIVRNAYLTS